MRGIMLALALTAGMLLMPAAGAIAQSDDIALTGSVVRQDDTTATRGIRGASVRLLWASNAEREAEIKTGTIITVAEATTDADGRYVLRAKPTPAIEAAAARNDRWVNFTLQVIAPSGHFTMTAVSRALVDGAWTGRGRPEFGTGREVVSVLAFDKSGRIVNGGRLSSAQRATADARLAQQNCNYVTDREWVQSVRVGNFHNTVGIDSHWQYGRTADSDVDAGIKYSGGSWGISGSAHIGNSASAEETHRTSNNYDKYVRTYFSFREYHETCYLTRYIAATDWKGGADDDGDTFRSCYTEPYSNYKREYRNGDTIHIRVTRASRIGFAVDAGPINLGQTSGYSYSMDMYWDLRASRMFCGYRDYPAGSQPGPGVIYNHYI